MPQAPTRATVLIVFANEQKRTRLKRFLEGQSVNVLVAGTYPEGLRIAIDSVFPIRLLIADPILLPGARPITELSLELEAKGHSGRICIMYTPTLDDATMYSSVVPLIAALRSKTPHLPADTMNRDRRSK